MPGRRLVLVQVAALIVALLGVFVESSAQTADDLFDASRLHEIRLYVHSADLKDLREHWADNTYYPADLEWRGLRVRNVAIRARGLGSRNPIKLGLRVDVNRYTNGQRFLGLTSIVLDNLWQDPSLLREPLAMTVFTRMGLAAPREAFVRLYVNNTYEGLYTVVEDVAKPFLARAFETDAGFLFEYKWVRPYRAEYLGDTLDAYLPLFEAKTREGDAAEALYGPIRELTRLADAAEVDAGWLDAVSQYVDVERLLTYVAVEAAISQLDGLLGYAGMNNFYLHRRPDATRHVFIPWDQDFAFFDGTSSLWQRVDENALVRRLLALPDVRARYLDEVERCAWLFARDDWLAAEVERLVGLVEDAARDDLRKQYPDDQRAAAIEALRSFARDRAGRLLEEVAAARRQAVMP